MLPGYLVRRLFSFNDVFARSLIHGFFSGFVFGYTSYSVFGAGIITMLFVALGSSFGMLGGKHENPFNIEKYEFLTLFILSFILTIPFYSLLYFDLLGVLSLSIIVSMLSAQIKFWYDFFSRTHYSGLSTSGIKPIDARV